MIDLNDLREYINLILFEVFNYGLEELKISNHIFNVCEVYLNEIK